MVLNVREPVVVLAHSPRQWAQRLHFFLMDHGGAIVRGYVMSPEDALSESYDVLLVDDITSFLTRRLIEHVQSQGSRILGVYDADDVRGAGKQRLLDLGVDDAITADVDPIELLEVVTRLAKPLLAASTDVSRSSLETRGNAPRRPAVGAGQSHSSRGQIVAVAAASGGVGATEIAIELASSVRRRGLATALLDVDEQTPSVVQRLGLPQHPNIRTAVDSLQHGRGDTTKMLIAMPQWGVEILGGLPNPRDWSELRPGDVGDLIEELASTRDCVVANVGSRVDDLPGHGGPPRFGVTRAALAMADDTVVVGDSSPVGARRIIDWLADTVELLKGSRIHVVVNRHPGSRFAAGELETELREATSPRSVTFVPLDRRVPRAAWSGHRVTRGPFTKAVDGLAGRLALEQRATVA